MFPSKTSWWPPRTRSYAEKGGVIYRYKCDRVDCDEEYIGESSTTFGERFKEHQKAPFPIYNHYNITGPKISIDNFSIVGREDQNVMRTIKEALYIRVNNPSLNRNIGKYHLPYIWDEVLFNTSELKITYTHTHTRKQISGSLLFYIIALITGNVSINKGLQLY